MSKIKYIVLCLVALLSCSKDTGVDDNTLASYVENRNYKVGEVIACAASDKDTGAILAFYYPESGASNFRFYETESSETDENNFENYTRQILNSEPVFNGHLGVFTQQSSTEKWIVITFELENEIKISNPIRSKQLSKPTIWNDAVSIEQQQVGMPNFMWEDNPEADNAIYFQVVSNSNNDLLSGTYTYQNQFQYYKLDNVVLNVTTKPAPNLVLNEIYNFTLMDVSLDNWVNWVVQKSFIVE